MESFDEIHEMRLIFCFINNVFFINNKLFKIEDIYGYERSGEGQADVFDDIQKE